MEEDNKPIKLTQEELDTLVELSKKPSLNLDGAGYSFRYYGVDRKENKDDIKIIESILVKLDPTMVSFSNFTSQEPNKIRFQSRWSDIFTGVNYINIPKEI